MMEKEGRKLSLDRPAYYQIKVPGRLEESWSDWVEGMTIQIEQQGDGLPFTIMTGCLDQATLQGLLRRLYGLGLPLVSVICLERDLETGSCTCQDEKETEEQ